MSGLASPAALSAPRWISALPNRYFLDRNLAAGFDLFHKEVDLTNVASFKQRSTGGNLRLGFPIADNTQMGLRYRFEQEDIFDVSNNASLAVKESEGVSNHLERRLHHRL